MNATDSEPAPVFARRDRSSPRRAANTAWARQRRHEQQALRNAPARTCQVGRAPDNLCGGWLETRFDRLGRTFVFCSRCERRRQGICRDCSQCVHGHVGYSKYCAGHAAAHHAESIAQYKARNLAALRDRSRHYYRDNPEVRASRNAYKRLYRLIHRDKVKAQKYRAGVRHNAAREKMLAYHRRYNAQRREVKTRAWKPRQRETRFNADGGRLCWTERCDAVVRGREKKCARCKAEEERLASLLLTSYTGRGRRSALTKRAAA